METSRRDVSEDASAVVSTPFAVENQPLKSDPRDVLSCVAYGNLDGNDR